MSKLVNWGHWAVGIFFAFGAALSLSRDAVSFAQNVRSAFHGQPVSFYSFYLDVLWSVLALLCAWGIIRWRLWAHYLALFLSIVDLAIIVGVVYFTWGMGTDIRFVCLSIVSALVTVWLLLPGVRRQYVRASLAI